MLSSSLHSFYSCSCGVCRDCKRAKKSSFKNKCDSFLDNYFDGFPDLNNSLYELFHDENDLFLEEHFFSELEEIEDLFAGEKSGYSSDHFAARLVAVISKMRPSFLSGEISFSVHIRDGSRKLVVKAVGLKTDKYKCSNNRGRYVGAINPDIVYRLPSKKLVNLEVDDSSSSSKRHQDCHLAAMQGAYDSAGIIKKFTDYDSTDKNNLLTNLKKERLSNLLKNRETMNKHIRQIKESYKDLFQYLFETVPEHSHNYSTYQKHGNAVWKRKVFGVIVNSVKQKNYLKAFKKFWNESEPPKTMSKFIVITSPTTYLPKIKSVKNVTYFVKKGRILSKTEPPIKELVSIKDLKEIKKILESST